MVEKNFILEVEEDGVYLQFDKMWIEEERIFIRFSNGTTPQDAFEDKYRDDFKKEEEEDVYSISPESFVHRRNFSSGYYQMFIGGGLSIVIE